MLTKRASVLIYINYENEVLLLKKMQPINFLTSKNSKK